MLIKGRSLHRYTNKSKEDDTDMMHCIYFYYLRRDHTFEARSHIWAEITHLRRDHRCPKGCEFLAVGSKEGGSSLVNNLESVSFDDGHERKSTNIFSFHIQVDSLNWLIDWQSVPMRTRNCDAIWMQSKRYCTEPFTITNVPFKRPIKAKNVHFEDDRLAAPRHCRSHKSQRRWR